MAKKRKKLQKQWTHIGTGVRLDRPETIVELGFPDSFRKGHFWCFGTTRVGKTRLMERIIEQDISKGYSVVAIAPKGDIDLFSKITQLADDTGRLQDLMLITSHISTVQRNSGSTFIILYAGRAGSPYHSRSCSWSGTLFFRGGVAYEVSLVVGQALIMLAEVNGIAPSFNLNDIKNHISH